MAKPRKGSDLKLSGSTLGSRFSMAMSISLAVVMICAGAFLYSWFTAKAEEIQDQAFLGAVQIQGPWQQRILQDLKREAQGLPPLDNEPIVAAQPIQGKTERNIDNSGVSRMEVMYGEGFKQPGYLYQWMDVDPPLIVSKKVKERAGEGLLPMIVIVTALVILVGALVAWMVGQTVSRPLEMIVSDINQIASGNLRHRTRVRAGGEILQLAKAIDRMAGNLESAQAAQLELSVREREIDLAGEVREALLPQSTPAVQGYELASLHVDSPTPGGDFHEFIELPDGRVGLLVCDVSGRGVPGALIGAIARSYLRVHLQEGGDLAQAFARANRDLARDVRRGMYVTALYALLDPAAGIATVACAGHKLPIVRYTGADQKIRIVHPEGIALGFDKGPVFERALQVQKIPIEKGDRILLSTTGAVQVLNADGAEYGEKAFYRAVLQHSQAPTGEVLERVKATLDAHAGKLAFPNDISMIALARPA